ncbi:SDR family oxidoreductase [Phyllobacterium sp. P30BS-XVII]|uniref:SDR family oxidoreductase n=1 Tax=Phyllobacterium sp. P30BS-XVII TaxID=2587046 RepID=UPI0015FAFC09|nr:SDR family oxidoreductase [Phyllobacterium sp. P30BS-XVII]MBA8900834.1 uncharacterized protein YbjT (DUF2867 family) [Phyllobacterium sp. P30BS-XVII]
MKILVLGGNGFIGQAVCQKLAMNGHSVTGIGRSIEEARQRLPEIEWQSVDIGKLLQSDAWLAVISGMDSIVNCAGALQNSARDDVTAVQQSAMLALYQAAQRVSIKLIVQISAETEKSGAHLPFIATKRFADTALKQSTLPYVILRPALVIGRNANGGSALIRALASFPCFTPLIFHDHPVEFVALDDVSETVLASIEGKITPGSDFALVAPEPHTLAEVVAAHRAWLGLKPAPVLRLPEIAANLMALAADLAGHLGWRSPLRSTAIAIMMDGVVSGDIEKAGASAARPELLTLTETLSRHTAGAQDLWFARLYLLKPLIILTLSLFWITSGVLSLWSFAAAAGNLVPGFGPLGAELLTVITSLADIFLGVFILFRRHAIKAMLGMLLLSAAYLLAGTLLAPILWLDPLGPYVKVIPSMVLTLACLAIFNEC